jgi:dienelactone hydrolase
MLLKHVLGRAAAGFDRTVGATLVGRSRRARMRSSTESLGHDERLAALADIRREYDRPEHYEPASAFFPDADAPELTRSPGRRRPSASGPVEVVDLRWPSAFTPRSPDVASGYLRHDLNRRAAARVYLHVDRPRPAALLIHGYRWGQWPIEERVWPVSWLLDRGLDVALPVLPFHAVRAAPLAAPLFPSSDPRFTIEGFRQAVLDLRALIRHLRDRGAPSVGVMGMSLGAYTTALLATVEEGLSFAVPIIPVASIADIARASGRFTGDAEQRAAQHAALDAALRVASPLARAPLVEPDRVLVVAGQADRIAPLDHARRVAEHFAAPVETFHGGHLLQFGRAGAFEAIGRMLARLGVAR